MVLTAALLALGLACASAEAQNTRTAGADQKMVTLTGLLRATPGSGDGQSRESPNVTNDCGYRCMGATIVIPLGARPRDGDDAVNVRFGPPSVPFDIDGDGTIEMVAFPEPGSGAWLAIDLDGNGVIDNGRGLFAQNRRQDLPQRVRGGRGGRAWLHRWHG